MTRSQRPKIRYRRGHEPQPPTRKKSPALVEATGHIRKLIETGQYALHSRLPSERELSDLLGVGRAVVRRALDILEKEGRLWRHVGQGTFVGGQPGSVFSNIKELSSRTSPFEIFEFRLLVEPCVARLAATRATARDIRYLNFCIEKADEAKDWESYELWDNTFHRMIAECTKSVLFITLTDMVGQLRHLSSWSKLREATFRHSPEGRAFHRALVAAITRRDVTEAERVMRKHIATANQKMMSASERIRFEDEVIPEIVSRSPHKGHR